MVVKPRKDSGDGEKLKSAAKFWHRNRESSLDPAHAKRVWSRLERDVFPSLGDMPLQDISPPDVLRVIRKIEERGALDISRRAKQSIGQIFQFGIASGLCENDPTAHLRGALKPRPRVKHMAKLPLAQLPELVKKIDRYSDANPVVLSVIADRLCQEEDQWSRFEPSKSMAFLHRKDGLF